MRIVHTNRVEMLRFDPDGQVAAFNIRAPRDDHERASVSIVCGLSRLGGDLKWLFHLASTVEDNPVAEKGRMGI